VRRVLLVPLVAVLLRLWLRYGQDADRSRSEPALSASARDEMADGSAPAPLVDSPRTLADSGADAARASVPVSAGTAIRGRAVLPDGSPCREGLVLAWPTGSVPTDASLDRQDALLIRTEIS
jgi:hypothetical protein